MRCIFETPFLYVGPLAVCVFAVVYAYFKVSFTYWKKRNVPYVATIFPFGNVADAFFFRKPIGHVHEEFYKKLEGEKYGGIFAFTKTYSYFVIPILLKMFPLRIS